jgi:hypothetical protein
MGFRDVLALVYCSFKLQRVGASIQTTVRQLESARAAYPGPISSALESIGERMIATRGAAYDLALGMLVLGLVLTLIAAIGGSLPRLVRVAVVALAIAAVLLLPRTF